jgi:hypothetical protein
MWFLAMPGAGTDSWFVHLVAKLLDGDAKTRCLLSPGPFMDRPPRAIRALYYRYEMTRLGEPTHDFWKRTVERTYLPPLTRDDPLLLAYLRARGWN